MNVITADLPGHILFVIEHEGVKITAVKRGRDERGSFTKATRVYGAMDALAPELMALEPFTDYAIPMPSVDRSAEDNMRAKMWEAWKREATKVVADRLETLLEDVQRSGHINGVSRGKFSQKAGCTMCPCSPGFVLEGRVYTDESMPRGTRYPFDLHLDVVPAAE